MQFQRYTLKRGCQNGLTVEVLSIGAFTRERQLCEVMLLALTVFCDRKALFSWGGGPRWDDNNNY